MARQTRTSQLQIRVSPLQKATIRRRARRAGMSMSDWVLSQVLPDAGARFHELAGELAATEQAAAVLAELNDLLSSLTAEGYLRAVGERPTGGLPARWEAYLAAMVEQTAARLGVRPPPWTLDVPALDEPWFASSVAGLRLHLMLSSPPPFHRRNIFVDASVGDRV